MLEIISYVEDDIQINVLLVHYSKSFVRVLQKLYSTNLEQKISEDYSNLVDKYVSLCLVPSQTLSMVTTKVRLMVLNTIKLTNTQIEDVPRINKLLPVAKKV